MINAVSSITIKYKGPDGKQLSSKLSGDISVSPTTQSKPDKINITNASFTQQQYNANQLLNKPLNIIAKINQARPLQGNILLLGQKCTSILKSDDPHLEEFYSKDELDYIDKHSLTLFDGCKSCQPDCKQLLQLFEDIRDYHVWLNSVKDILLYNQTTCSTIYNKLYDKIAAYPSQIQRLENCSKNKLPERDLWLYGIRLVYQYKALVTLWNYLAEAKSRYTQLSTSAQDFSGINIICKSMIELCQLVLSGDQYKTQHKICLQFSVSVNQPQALPTDKQGNPKGKFALFLATDNNNTYIKHIQNASNNLVLSESWGSISGSNVSVDNHVFKLQTNLQGSVHRQNQSMAKVKDATIQFSIKPNIKQGGQAQLSAFIKVIPVWVPEQWSDHIMSLSDYQNFRKYNTQMPKQSGFNVWTVSYKWYVGDSPNQNVLQADSYSYSTPYTRVPTVQHILQVT